MSTGPSLNSEGVQTLFFNDATGHMQIFLSGDETTTINLMAHNT